MLIRLRDEPPRTLRDDCLRLLRSSSRCAEEGKRSLLSKYGWYLLIAFGYVGYKAVQEQAQKLK